MGLDSKGHVNLARWITEQVTGVGAGSLSPHAPAIYLVSLPPGGAQPGGRDLKSQCKPLAFHL